MEINYWNQFKHYFVRKMDQKSFSTLNLFYDYVCEIQEKQLLLKNLQKNSFFQIQNILSGAESQLIATGPGQIWMTATQGQGSTMDQFWAIYKLQQERLKFIINQNALTEYTPVQIRISMEKVSSVCTARDNRF